jgi:hypothetical protein
MRACSECSARRPRRATSSTGASSRAASSLRRGGPGRTPRSYGNGGKRSRPTAERQARTGIPEGTARPTYTKRKKLPAHGRERSMGMHHPNGPPLTCLRKELPPRDCVTGAGPWGRRPRGVANDCSHTAKREASGLAAARNSARPSQRRLGQAHTARGSKKRTAFSHNIRVRRNA